MIVVSPNNVESVQTSDEIVGQDPVFKKELVSAAATGGASILLVTFEPGAKLNFHAHKYDQVLIVTEGKGIVATKDEEKTVVPGDVIFIEEYLSL